MEKKNWLFACALCACMTFSLVGCNDDDDPVTPTVPTEQVTSISFTDADLNEGKISGTLLWTAPSSVENIKKYVIYLSADGKGKDTKLGEVEVGTNSFTIPEGTTVAAYILVVASNDLGESEAIASFGIEDKGEPIAPDVPEKAAIALSGAYVLSSGSQGSNNSSLTYYNFATKEIEPDLFTKTNNRGLGDTANDILIYGSKIYIAVYGSSVIEVTDLQGKSLKQITSDTSDPLHPRYFTYNEGKVYVSLYGGYVARLDTASLAIEAKVKVGRNPEQIAIAHDLLYVANSGGADHNTEVGYDKTVSIVRLSSFTEKKKLDVVTNPGNLVRDNQGDIYLISLGNYGDILNTFQRIDTEKEEVKPVEVTNATEMASVGDKLYLMYSQYDANWQQTISYISYDAMNESVISTNFITDGTAIAKPYKLSADAASNYIFVTESDYVTNGNVYAFNFDGKLQFMFEAGLNPVKVVSAAKQ